MSAVIDHAPPSAHAGDHAHEHPHGISRWLFSTNHKDIGTMYLLFALWMLFEGGILALGIRTELWKPYVWLLNPELYNAFSTMHGIMMIFGSVMPALVGFANWMIPLQIGAPDMAFPR
ncbi:MAG: cbb3-type cytochrome c oxidase subunit I, partial [Thiomonas sp.]